MKLEISQILLQMVAFLLMLWILKKFGWKTILDLLKERHKKIQTEFEMIDEQKKQVRLLTDEYREKLSGIDAEARRKIQEAILEGRKISMEIQQEAQTHANEMLEKTKEEMTREISNAKTQLKNDIVDIAIIAAEKILQEKIDRTKHAKLISEFVEGAELK